MNQSDTTFGYFGKLPNFADFVSFNSANDEIRNFDQWLQKGLMIAKSRLINKFDETYPAMPVYRFIFPSANNFSLAGSLYPGRDLSGRKFPFITYARITDSVIPANRFRFLSLFTNGLMQEFDNLFDEAKTKSSANELAGMFSSFHFSNIAEDNGTFYNFKSYSNSMTADQFWNESLPNADDKRPILKYLLEILSPLKNNYRSNFLLGIKLPFQYGTDGNLFQIGVWIEIIAALINDYSIKPFLFWTAQEETQQKNLFLYLNTPQPENLISLMAPDNVVDSLCDLTSMHDTGYASDLNINYKSLLDNNQITISEFIERLNS